MDHKCFSLSVEMARTLLEIEPRLRAFFADARIVEASKNHGLAINDKAVDELFAEARSILCSEPDKAEGENPSGPRYL